LSDPLTGLRNRRFLTQHLETDIARTVRRYDDWRTSGIGEPPADADVLFFLVDLDHFKFVNDRFGHHAGDMLLVQMRERLQEVFRESDFVVRWGGDEFLTVTRENSRTEAGPIAERIREAVANRPFQLDGGRTIDASVSVGFAAFPFTQSAPDAVTWLQVVAIADHALYMAKEAGRDTWFGLAATERTDPKRLARLDVSAEELVTAGALLVMTRAANAYGTADAVG
jgi:diguanylate cyclase (GGDEF)-like protein